MDPDLLEAAATQMAARIGQETLTARAEAAEEKARQRISEVAAIYEVTPQGISKVWFLSGK